MNLKLDINSFFWLADCADIYYPSTTIISHSHVEHMRKATTTTTTISLTYAQTPIGSANIDAIAAVASDNASFVNLSVNCLPTNHHTETSRSEKK